MFVGEIRYINTVLYTKQKNLWAGASSFHDFVFGNDFGYEHIFSRYLEAHANQHSCLFAISTSGTSKNVIKAAEYANEIGIPVIALTGKSDKRLGEFATIEICTPGGKYADRVQELHIKVIHIIIELIEREFYPELYQ